MTDSKEKLKGVEFIPPPSEAGKASKGKSSSGSKSKKGGLTITQLENGLKSNFELLGIALTGFDEFDGNVIVDKAPELASALTELAKANPRVRASLESLLEVGAWGGVITVFGGQIMLPIAVHHNWLPDNINRMLAEQGEIPVKGQRKVKTDDDGITHITVDDGKPDNPDVS